MALNNYFQKYNNNEGNLLEDLVQESIQVFGHEVSYLPRTQNNLDNIFGEATASSFESAYPVEVYIKTTDGFEGEGAFVGRFGLEIREDTTLMVSKRRFHNKVNVKTNLEVPGRPNEGDILFFPLMNSFFEIQFVEDQEPFFQLGNLPVYKLRVTRWEYANETIATGVAGIDAKEAKYSVNLLVDRFTLEDEKGTVQLEQDDTKSGNANFLINESYDATKTTVQTQSDYAQNLDLDTAAGFDTESVTDDVLDFTERNPFGEVDQ